MSQPTSQPTDPSTNTATEGTRAPAHRPMGKVAVYTALTQLALPITSLATAPILARNLAAQGRGEMAAAVGPILILMWVASIGLPESTAYAVAKLKQSPYRVLSHAGRLSLAYGVVATVLVWVLAPMFLHRAPGVVPLLRGVALLLPAMMWGNLVRSAVISMRLYSAAATERVLTPVLRLVSFVVLLLAGQLTVATATWSQMLCTITGALYLWAVLRRERRVAHTFAAPVPHLTREIASFGFKGWGGVLGNLITWRLDQVVLVTLVPTKQVGYYVVAVSFSAIAAMAVNSVRNVLFAESAHRNSPELIARAARVITLGITLSAVVGCLLAGPVVRILFGAGFEPSVALAQVLLVGSIPFCLDQVLAAGIYAEGRPFMRTVSQVVAAFVTIGGLFALAPVMGAMGAAVASLVAYSTTCAVTMWQYRRVTGMPLRRMVLPERTDLAWVGTKVRSRVGAGS